MKIATRCFACLLALMALAAAAFGIWVSLTYKDELPIMLRPSQEAAQTAQKLLAAVKEGDYEAAGNMLLGQPRLGVDRDDLGQVVIPEQNGEGLEKLSEEEKETLKQVKLEVWKAYQESLTFTPEGDLFVTEAGMAQQFRVRYLKIEAVTASLGQRCQENMEKRVAAAENREEIYEEGETYRKDVVCAVLLESAAQALETAKQEEASYEERVFTVNLVFQDGTWWALPDSELLDAISGSLAK